MDLEKKIVEALLAELSRQSQAGRGLRVGEAQEGVVTVEGPVNLEELAMAVAGAVAGGP
jgi:hypothetical protein